MKSILVGIRFFLFLFCLATFSLAQSLPPGPTPNPEGTTVGIVALDNQASEPGILAVVDQGTFVFTRTGGIDFDLPVYLRIGGTASNGVDYMFISNTIVIPRGQNQARLHVVPLMDNLTEHSETVVIQIEHPNCIAVFPPPPTCYSIAQMGYAIVTIRDQTPTNTLPSIRITSPEEGQTFLEGTNIWISAVGSDPDGVLPFAEFFANDHKLGNGYDLSLRPVGPGIPSYFGFVWTNVPVGTHELSTRVTDADGNVATSPSVRVTVSRNLPDWPTVNVFAARSETAEPSPNSRIAPGVFRFTRSGNTNSPLTVFFGISGSAINGVDYTYISNRVIIPIGATEVSLFVNPLEDSLDEGTETIEVTLLNPCLNALTIDPASCYTTGSNRHAIVSIADAPAETNHSPQVTITSPTNGAAFAQGTTITIRASTIDSDGFASRVDFFANSIKIGQRTRITADVPTNGTELRFEFAWTNAPVGNHTLVAQTFDNLGASSYSLPIQVTVTANNEPSVLIARGSVWKYLDNGTDQGTSWRSRDFDDSTWASGPGQLGYGDGDEATIVSFGGNAANKHITTYFRRSFEVHNPATISNLVFGILRDDGVVVYLNGVQVVRSNMPEGPVTYSTLAFNAADENTYLTFTIPPTALVSGRNVIAAEVHQISPTSSDLGFDLELRATVGQNSSQGNVVNIVVSDPEAIEPTAGASQNRGRFTIRREGNLDHTLFVHYTVSGTATTGMDYIFLPGTVAIPIGQHTASVEVIPLPDGVNEDPESVTITINAPVCAAIAPPPPGCYVVGPSNAATVTIYNRLETTNQPPVVRITNPSNRANFLLGQPISIRAFTMDQDGYAPRVEFFANGHKISEEELVFIQPPPPGSTLEFEFVWTNAPAGEHVLTVATVDNQGARGVSDPVTILVAGSHTNTVVSLVATDPHASESGDTGMFTFRRTGNLDHAILVFYRVQGTAGNGFDYQSITNQIQIPSGQSEVNLLINPIPDNLAESPESVSIILQAPPCYAVFPPPPQCYQLGSPFSAVVVIRDSPGTNFPSNIEISQPTNNAYFVAGSNIRISAVGSDPDGIVELVEFFANGRKIGESPDVAGRPPMPQQPSLFSMTWSNVNAGTYTLTAATTDANGVTTTSLPISITVTGSIPQEPIVNVAATRAQTSEPGPLILVAPGEFTFTRTGSTESPLTVYYRMSGTASNGVDYELLPGQVTIPAGTNRTRLLVLPRADNILEQVETVVLTLQPIFCAAVDAILPGCYQVGTSNQATVAISNSTTPSERELHVVSVYSGLINGSSSHNHERGFASVHVNRPGKHITLLLSAYEPVDWTVTMEAGTTIEKVYISGYYRQSITGLPPNVPVVRSSHEEGTSYLYVGYEIESARFYNSIPRINELTGLAISSFFGNYTAPALPVIVDTVQNDPRLAREYPVTHPSQLPSLQFDLTFYAEGRLNTRRYTLSGPVDGGALLPGMKVVPDDSGTYFIGTRSHEAYRINRQSGQEEQMTFGPALPELSWPRGVALDAANRRVLLASLGGEGFLYGYSSNRWSVISSMNNNDVNAIVVHSNRLFGVSANFGESGSPWLREFNFEGEPTGHEVRLPHLPYAYAAPNFRVELVSAGKYIILLSESLQNWGDSQDEGRIYLIDPGTGEYWLTYRKLGRPQVQPPVVALRSPHHGSYHTNGLPVSFRAHATDADGVISIVEFYVDGLKVGNGWVNEAGEYQFIWMATPGRHVVWATAMDSGGNSGSSEEVTIFVSGVVPNPTIDDLCPCDRPWESRLDYLRCVINNSWNLFRDGHITELQRIEIIDTAAHAACGTVPAPQILIQPQTAAEIRAHGLTLVLTGGDTENVVIQSSTDLVNWVDVETSRATASAVSVSCDTMKDDHTRFYRIKPSGN